MTILYTQSTPVERKSPTGHSIQPRPGIVQLLEEPAFFVLAIGSFSLMVSNAGGLGD